MKKTDVAMIILIAAMGIIGAFFGTRAVLGEGSKEEVKVNKIEEIKPGLSEVNPEIFNSDAINPAVEVTVAEQQPQQ